MPETLNSNVKNVADDTKLFRTQKNKSDYEILQADLDNLSEWSKKIMVPNFKHKKCKRMHVSIYFQ